MPQNAYRARIAPESCNLPGLRRPNDAARHARQLCQRARLARREAAVTRRKAAAVRGAIDHRRRHLFEFYEVALNYARRRHQFNPPLASLQVTQQKPVNLQE
jgi:alkylation response protein AidB-like acyl-CoA dehydrogenase